MILFSYLANLLVDCNSVKESKQTQILFVSAQSGLYLRSKPNNYSQKLALIPFQTKLEILSETPDFVQIDEFYSNWKKVSYENLEGYVFGGYLVENLEKDSELYQMKLSELMQLGKSLQKTDPLKSSHIFSVVHKRTFNNPTCKNIQIQNSKELDFCLNSCLKIIEPVECNFLENQNRIESFQLASEKIIDSLRKNQVEELIPFLDRCFMAKSLNCYICDGPFSELTTSREKILALRNWTHLIDFSRTEINKTNKNIEFFSNDILEKRDTEKFSDSFEFDLHIKNSPRFFMIKLIQKGKFWRIEELDGRMENYLETEKRFCKWEIE